MVLEFVLLGCFGKGRKEPSLVYLRVKVFVVTSSLVGGQGSLGLYLCLCVGLLRVRVSVFTNAGASDDIFRYFVTVVPSPLSAEKKSVISGGPPLNRTLSN